MRPVHRVRYGVSATPRDELATVVGVMDDNVWRGVRQKPFAVRDLNRITSADEPSRVVGLEIDFEILVPRQFGADLGGGLVIGVGLGVRVSRVDEGSDPLRAQA